MEIASAYLSLIPSLRGASRTIQRELDPLARRSGQRFGNDFGDAAGQGAGSGLRDGLDNGADGDSAGAKFGKLFGLAAGATAGLGLGAAVVDATTKAMDREVDLDRVAASLGLGEQQAAVLGRTAGALYRDNFGETFTDSANAVGAVKAAFRDLDGGELKRVSGLALSFADIFESDVPRTISVARTAVQQGLAKDATEALDLLTVASQKVGPALAPDVQDAVEEYGGFFKQIGLDGPAAFGLLVRGADQGTFGIDKTGDAVAEFSKLVTGDMARTEPVIKRLGLNYTDTANALLAGGEKAGDATRDIVNGLLAVKDPAKQTRLALELFGTPLEDLGTDNIPKFLRALSNGGDELGKFEGAAQKASDAVGDNARGRLESFRRDIESTFIDLVGGKVLPVLDTFTTKLQKGYRANGIEGVVTSLEGLTGLDGVLVPIFEDVQDGIGSVVRIGAKLAPAFADAAENLAPIISPLGLVADGLEVLADVVEAIPDDVASLALQAGAVALVLPKLRSALVATNGAMVVGRANVLGYFQALRYGSQYSQQAATAATRMGGAFKTAAGIGGVLALSSGLGETDTAAGKLQTSLGAAGLGLALGGLPGLIVGGAVGALISFKDEIGNVIEDIPLLGSAFEGVGDAFSSIKDEIAPSLRLTEEFKNIVEAATPSVGAYADSLDQVSGATTRATRAAILLQAQEKGALKQSARLGISARDLVGATLGQEGAIKRVNAAYSNAITVSGRFGDVDGNIVRLTGLGTQQFEEKRRKLQALGYELIDTSREEAKAANVVRTFLGAQRESIKTDAAAVRQKQRVNQQIGLLKGLVSKKLFLTLDSKGLPVTERGLARIVANQKEFQGRKALTAVIKASGVTTTVKDLRRIIAGLDEVDKKPAKLDAFRQTLTRHIGDFRSQAGDGGRDIAERLTDGSRRAKFDSKPLDSSLRSGTTGARRTAYTGGLDVGNQLEAGIISGFATAKQRLSSDAAEAVSAAIQAARDRAKVKSPSRETYYIGDMMARGLVDGMAAGRRTAASEGARLVAASIGGFTGSAIPGLSMNYGLAERQARALSAQRVGLNAAVRTRPGVVATSAPAAGGTGPRTMVLRVGEREFVGFVEDLADDRVQATVDLGEQGRRSRWR